MVESLEKGHKELLAIVGIAFLPFLIAGVLFIGLITALIVFGLSINSRF